jgi:hypothetical protein
MPIEIFLNKARVAVRSGQKHITLDIKDVQMLAESLAVVMTRLAGDLDAQLQTKQVAVEAVSIKMDGGGFR